MSDEETGDETIGDVLSRTSKLLKDDMTTEVEAYGLQVDPSWTKDEIMEHFEEFLTEQADVEPDAEEVVAEEPAVLPPLDLPTPPPPPPTLSAEPSIVPAGYTEPQPASPNVRIMRAPGWGKTGGAYAP
jgi:hypothetical protein